MTELFPLSLLLKTGQQFLISLFFLLLIVIIIKWKEVGIEKYITSSAIRGFLQLLILSTVLIYIFTIQIGVFVFLFLLPMIWFSARTAAGRLQMVAGIYKTQLLSQSVAIFLVMGIAVLLQIIPMTPEFVIPIGGMVAGNSMNISYLAVNRTVSEVKIQDKRIESALALGATPSEILSKFGIIRNAIEASITPNVNNLRTLGIVAIPGLMSGMIIGGVNPIVAGFYQVLIFFLIISGGLISALITLKYSVIEMFDKDNLRLNLIEPPETDE